MPVFFLSLLATFLPFLQEPTRLPPGTMRVGEYLVDKTEVANIHWLEYLHFRKQELDSARYSKLLPDTANSWYNDPAYRFVPLVLISHQQAKDYCAWRSQVVSEKLGREITYRLPTPGEWRAIAEHLYQEKTRRIERRLRKKRKELKKHEGNYMLQTINDPKKIAHHFFDNVSEMTAVPGLAMGRNNHDLLLETDLMQPIAYRRPNLFVGFRCIAEIAE